MEQPKSPDRADLVKPAASGAISQTPANPDNGTPAVTGEPAPPVPLTPVAWLYQNAVYLLAFVLIIGALYLSLIHI